MHLSSGLHDSFASECAHLKYRNLTVLKFLKQSLVTQNINKKLSYRRENKLYILRN